MNWCTCIDWYNIVPCVRVYYFAVYAYVKYNYIELDICTHRDLIVQWLYIYYYDTLYWLLTIIATRIKYVCFTSWRVSFDSAIWQRDAIVFCQIEYFWITSCTQVNCRCLWRSNITGNNFSLIATAIDFIRPSPIISVQWTTISPGISCK